jgi:hypothetical protein
MIRVSLPNIITIALAGALGYSLLVGLQKLRTQLTNGG